MLIRTQDRKRIVNFNNLVSISCLEMAVYAEIDNGTGFFKLGEYKTHERAMEVLDSLCVAAEFKSMMILTMIMPKE